MNAEGMPITRNQKKRKSTVNKSTGASVSVTSQYSAVSGTLDKYLKPKQDKKTTTQSSEEMANKEDIQNIKTIAQSTEETVCEEDIQAKLNKILLAVKPINEMNNKLDQLRKDFTSLKSTVDQHSSDIVEIRKDLAADTTLSQKLEQEYPT